MNIHEETLKIARNLMEKDPSLTDWVIGKFPELADSEDEKIRKRIISALVEWNEKCSFPGDSDDMIAWLEKQCEHANFRNKIQIGDKVTRNEDGVLVNLSQLKRIAKPAEEYNITGIGSKNAQGKMGEMIKNLKPVNEVLEQNSADKVEPKFKVGQTIKKEGFNLGFTIAKIKGNFYYNDVGDNFPFTDQDNWELVEQNPVWSKEDERMLNHIIKLLDGLTNLHNWLKSLKGRYTWKPSEEQIEVLEDTIKAYNEVSFPTEVRVLSSLLSELKKL